MKPIRRIGTGFALAACVAFIGGCDARDAAPEAQECPSAHPTLPAQCEPQIAPCVSLEDSRPAEAYRGQFGSLGADGTCQQTWPQAWLAGCTEPIADGVPDVRGLWADEGHVERVEQCGNLVLVVGDNYTHGGFATGLPEDGVHDFRADGTCSQPIEVALRFKEQTLEFVVGDWVVVTRSLEVSADGVDELVWRFGPDLPEVARMRRYCVREDVPATAVSGLP